MASDTKRSNSKAEGVWKQSTVSDIQLALQQLCLQNGLTYGGAAPLAVSPGVFMFYGSRCDRWGACRQRQYFATQLNNKWMLC